MTTVILWDNVANTREFPVAHKESVLPEHLIIQSPYDQAPKYYKRVNLLHQSKPVYVLLPHKPSGPSTRY